MSRATAVRALIGALLVVLMGSAALPTATSAGAMARDVPRRAPAAWPERHVLREGLAISSQALSTESLYALISETQAPQRGPYRLERRDLRTGIVRKGPASRSATSRSRAARGVQKPGSGLESGVST